MPKSVTANISIDPDLLARIDAADLAEFGQRRSRSAWLARAAEAWLDQAAKIEHLTGRPLGEVLPRQAEAPTGREVVPRLKGGGS